MVLFHNSYAVDDYVVETHVHQNDDRVADSNVSVDYPFVVQIQEILDGSFTVQTQDPLQVDDVDPRVVRYARGPVDVDVQLIHEHRGRVRLAPAYVVRCSREYVSHRVRMMSDVVIDDCFCKVRTHTLLLLPKRLLVPIRSAVRMQILQDV